MSSVSIQGNASGTGTLTIAAPNTNTDYTLTLPQATTTIVGTDATQTLTNKTIQGGAITSGTSQASTSGTSIDFTGIPSWVKRITVMFSGVSTNGTSNLLIQLGDSGGIETTGYVSYAAITTTVGTAEASSTAGFVGAGANASGVYRGMYVLCLVDVTAFSWVGGWSCGWTNGVNFYTAGGGGTKALSATLDRVRITTANGTDTFDAGTINILYEG